MFNKKIRNKKSLALLILLCVCTFTIKAQQMANKTNNSYFGNHPFLWGAASAAYQVEGADDIDGKGLSNWDVWMNKYEVAGKGVNGSVAINFYERKQYLKDIALMKEIGLNSYRFSISWPRILPKGTGAVNKAGIEHYRTFVKDLKAAGIEPVMTLYHWDLPYALYEKGGWNNRESVEWFREYAKVVFDNFKDLVKIYVLSNEMLIETGTSFMAEDKINNKELNYNVVIPAPDKLETALNQFNHKLLAAAGAAKLFHSYNISQGEVGVAFPLTPTIAVNPESAAAAEFVDGIGIRWFLDAVYKGTYPADILDYAKKHQLNLKIKEDDAKEIQRAGMTYLGINYYAPMFIQKDTTSKFYGFTVPKVAGTDYAFNGPNRPDQLERLLLRIKDEYGNPPVVITENGVGFEKDDQLVNGVVNDSRRIGYLKKHIEVVLSAKDKGANIFGYHVWSSHDNLEWLSGYGSRFGMIYVDFDTQQRILKNSAKEYGKIIKEQIQK